VIPQERTAVPVEYDDFRQQLQKLTETLQPTQPGGVSTLGHSSTLPRRTYAGREPTSATPSSNCRRPFRYSAITAGDLFSTLKNLSILVSRACKIAPTSCDS